MEKKRRRKKRNKLLWIPLWIVFGAILTGAIYMATTISFNAAKEITESDQIIEGNGEFVSITIPQGATTKEIASILSEGGLIDNEFMFRVTSRLGDYDGTYMQGDYVIQKGVSDESIMKTLQKGVIVTEVNKVTIPEGFTTMQIAERLEENEIVTAEEFMTEMNEGVFNYEFLANVPQRENYLEGYLFPATYDFPEGATANDVIVAMLNRFEISYSNILKESGSDLTIDELVIVASLVESEIQVAEERPIAAGVIYNRLEDGMLLQIDSSVQYALSTRNEVVTLNDLEVDSPYNTYKYTGLPEGPICNPGDSALEAAVNPEEHNYIYYVVKERGSGAHVFTETYDEFLDAKAAYQASFNE